MRKFIFSFFWCVLFISMTFGVINAQEVNQYKWLHQTPQGNTLRWVKMWDANNWYAVGYGATFMKTTNAGASWYLRDNIYKDATGGYELLYDAYFIDMNTGWAGGNGGKIMKTTNAGVTWDTSGFAVSTSATWYGLYFMNANTGFAAGTSSGRVAMTTDGGATWTQMGTPPSATYYNVYAKDVNNVIATSTSGNIRKTTDGGTTWSTISTGTSATLYRVNFMDANTGYVSGSSSAIRFTTDFGDTWTSTNTGVASSTFYDIDFSTGPVPPGYTEDFTSVTFPPTGWTSQSVLGAAQWVRTTSQFVSSPASAFMDYQATGGDDWLITPQWNIVAGDSLVFYLRKQFTTNYIPDSTLVKVSTTDNVLTSFTSTIFAIETNSLTNSVWTRFAVSINSYAGQSIYIAFQHKDSDGNGVYLDNVSVGLTRPATQDYVYITGNSFNIYKSAVGQDAFDTVQFLDPSQPWTSTFYATSLSTTGDSLMTVGASGLMNVRYSPSNRVSYTNYIKAGTLYDIWAESSTGRVIAVGAPGIAGSVFDQVMYSTNGGANWQLGNFSATADEDLNGISMVDAMTGYVVGDEGGVHKTTDGGATWNPTTATGTTTELERAVFLNANTGYVFGDDGNNHKTTDGGATWTPYVWGGGTGDVYTASFVDVNTGWVAGASGDVYKTTDGGATTTSQNANVGTSIIYSVKMLNATTGWLSSTTGRVRRTTDGGTTWDTCDVPFSTTLYSVNFVDQWNGIVTGLTGRVFRTRDGGTTWETNNTSAGTLYNAKMTATNRAFVVGTNAGIWKYEENVTGNEITFTNNVPERYFLDQNYPNPFNPSTTIKFGLPREGAVSLKVFDMAGREVANIINNERMNAGIVSYNFNGSALASGVYFYTLVVDNDLIATKKMVLVK